MELINNYIYLLVINIGAYKTFEYWTGQNTRNSSFKYIDDDNINIKKKKKPFSLRWDEK